MRNVPFPSPHGQAEQYRFDIDLEADDFEGYHCILIDEGDTVVHITNSFNTPEDALQAAHDWIAHREKQPTIKLAIRTILVFDERSAS